MNERSSKGAKLISRPQPRAHRVITSNIENHYIPAILRGSLLGAYLPLPLASSTALETWNTASSIEYVGRTLFVAEQRPEG